MDNFISEIVDVCKLPFSELMNKFKVIQIDDKIIYISNFIKLLDYGSEKIVLKVKNGTLEILGEDLKISLINKKEIVIRGIIKSFGLGVKNEK